MSETTDMLREHIDALKSLRTREYRAGTYSVTERAALNYSINLLREKLRAEWE